MNNSPSSLETLPVPDYLRLWQWWKRQGGVFRMRDWFLVALIAPSAILVSLMIGLFFRFWHFGRSTLSAAGRDMLKHNLRRSDYALLGGANAPASRNTPK